jgi:Icc-related predicted phosphoesterase
MKIFFTTDIHAHPSLLEQLVREVGRHRIDALIIGGDIVPHSLPQARALGLLDAQAAGSRRSRTWTSTWT